MRKATLAISISLLAFGQLAFSQNTEPPISISIPIAQWGGRLQCVTERPDIFSEEGFCRYTFAVVPPKGFILCNAFTTVVESNRHNWYMVYPVRLNYLGVNPTLRNPDYYFIDVGSKSGPAYDRYSSWITVDVIIQAVDANYWKYTYKGEVKGGIAEGIPCNQERRGKDPGAGYQGAQAVKYAHLWRTFNTVITPGGNSFNYECHSIRLRIKTAASIAHPTCPGSNEAHRDRCLENAENQKRVLDVMKLEAKNRNCTIRDSDLQPPPLVPAPVTSP